jgi:inner membrane protein
MHDSTVPLSTLRFTFTSRSLGMKLLLVCGLALAMMIPSLFVEGLVEERSRRAQEVVQEVSSHVGGEQTLLGPTLAIPYSTPTSALPGSAKHGVYLVFPAQASANLKLQTEERRRSLFRVPIFQTNAEFDASFDLTGVPHEVPEGTALDWSRAEIITGLSDARGVLADAVLTTGGTTSSFAPAVATRSISLGAADHPLKLTLFGAKMEHLGPDAHFSVHSTLRFSGAQRVAVLAYGKSTQLAMAGNWANPGFDGGFLPIGRQITGSNFEAKWSVPFIARGVPAEGASDTITGLEATALGLSLIEMADPYQSVTRALKYAPLFLGLVFLSYFVFEATTGKRVHPAQYVLVGIAQIIFYLLLLSIAERSTFDLGFLLAGASTVALLSSNAGWVFASRKQALRAVAVFTLLYTLIYLLLRLEDNALLVGALTSFGAIAAAMYFTRDLDWYSTSASGAEGSGQASSLAPEPTA